MTSNKLTKLIISLTLIVIFLGSALFFAIIPFVKVDTSLNLKNPDFVLVYQNKTLLHTYNNDSEIYKDIMERYNDAYSTTRHELVFGLEKIENTKVATVTKTIDYKDGLYLVLCFNNLQTKKEKNTTIEFRRVVVKIENNEKMSKSESYIVKPGDNSLANYKYTHYSKSSELYSYLTNLA